MPSNPTQPPRSNLAGGCIVALLALIFFILLGLLFTYTRRDAPPVAAARDETLYVIPTRLRIRTAPSPKAPVLTAVLRGQQLRLLEDQGGWVKVKAPDGIEGWTERSYLEGEAEHDRRNARIEAIRKLPPLDGTVRKETPLYSGPGIFYPIVGNLAEQTKVRIFTRDHDFYAVEQAGEIVYADIDSIDVTATDAGARLEIAGGDAPPSTTETSTAIADNFPPPAPEPESARPPEPEPAPEPEPSRTAVYPVVPAGGTEPVIVSQVRPRYPMQARRRGTEGRVVLRMIVRRDGSIDDLEVIQGLPDGLSEAALDAVERWRFRPATFRGEPIAVYYTVTVRFRLAS